MYPSLNTLVMGALGMAEIYGSTGQDPRFADPFAKWLAMLWRDGTKATLEHYLQG